MNLFQPDIHLYSQMNWVGFRLGRIKLSSAKENTSPIPALRSRISAPPSLVSVSKWWFNFSLLTYVKEQQTQTNKFNIRTPYLKKKLRERWSYPSCSFYLQALLPVTWSKTHQAGSWNSTCLNFQMIWPQIPPKPMLELQFSVDILGVPAGLFDPISCIPVSQKILDYCSKTRRGGEHCSPGSGCSSSVQGPALPTAARGLDI